MWAGQPGHGVLQASRVDLDPKTCGERGMSCAATSTIGELHPDSPGWTEQLAIAIASSANAHDVWIDQSDRIAAETDSPERPHIRWAKFLAVFAASSCLAWAALLGADRFLSTDGVSAPPSVQSPNAPAGIANSSAGHRVETKSTIVRATDRSATARTPARPHRLAATRIAHPKPSRTVIPPAPSASSYVPPAPPAAASPVAATANPPTDARLVPVPETRPTTIDGWVLREVVNGTAVLQGPDGIWRAKPGDTVPGVGQVVSIFGWGNRLIVATSKGLISTP